MKYKTSIIMKEAPQIKSFIEKYKRIPKTCTIGNTTLSPYSAAYLLSKVVQDKFQSTEVNLANVIVYNKNQKFIDTIDEKIMKEDYLKMINNFLKFCSSNKRVPHYITTQKSQTKVSFELYFYCIAKIVNYYKENKALPNYCLFNKSIMADNKTSNNTSKKSNSKSTSNSTNTNIYISSPHPTKPGCGGMGQDTSYYCGVSALQKVLFKFNITDFSQSTLAKWAGTTRKGTGHDGIRTAVAKVNQQKGTNIKVSEKTFTEVGGWKGIAKVLANKNQDIIFHNKYRLEYGHYEVMNQLNLNTNYTKVLNSLGKKCTDTCYCGYVEDRSCTTMKQYMDAVTQKSLIILTKG